MPLNGYSSLCEEKQQTIVSRDRGSKREHRAENRDSQLVSQYKIDGEIVCDMSIRCDFIVMNDDKHDAYLIELKGSDIEHALDQLEATARRFYNELRGYHVKYRVVCSKARPHAIKGNKYKKFCKRHPRDEFICQEGRIVETI